MINLYYTPASGSISSSLSVIYDTNNNTSLYNDVTLEVSASKYLISGSSNYLDYTRVYIKSGSITYASFPIEETNIYYLNPIATPIISSSFLTNWNFSITSATSSANNIFAIYSSSLASASVYQTQSSNTGITSLLANVNYTVLVSGSGLFYTSSILITDDLSASTSSYVTASNTPVTTSISGSSSLSKYSIYAQTTTLPYITLTYTSSYYPVANTSSLSSWNSYLNISASSLSQSSANTFYLVGGNLSSVLTLDGLGQTLSNFSSFGLSNLRTFRSNASSLTDFFNISTLPSLTTLELYNNKITGSILSLNTASLVSSSVTTINIGNNKISGSISNVLSVFPQSIQYVDCSINYLTGSIPILSQSYALSYFDCSYNQLSGSMSSLDGSYSLQYFDCSDNRLTGSIPVFTTNSISLQSFDCSYNQLSGIIPNLSSSVNLQYFNCNNNILTGSIDISGSSNLISFVCNNNKLSGSINSLEGCVSLSYFDYSYNHILGDIPRLTNTPNLTDFICSYNGDLQDYIFTTDTLPATLLNFQAYNANVFKQSAIDGILYGLDAAGNISGSVNLSGSSNATPSTTGYSYTSSLKNKGWIVYTN